MSGSVQAGDAQSVGPASPLASDQLPNDYAAIGLARALLQVLGADLSAPKRNVHTSLRVARRANAIYNSIYKLITKVYRADEPDWISFDTYTSAIDPLEDIAFDFGSKATIYSSIEPITLSVDKAIDDLSLSVRLWESERNEIENHLATIHGEKFDKLSKPDDGTRADIEFARKLDDEALIDHLIKRMEGVSMKDSNLHPKTKDQPLTDVRKKAKDIKSKLQDLSAPKELTTISIECVLIVCMVMEKADASQESTFLKSPDAWRLADKLFMKVLSELERDAGHTDLKIAYDEYIKALGGTVKLPPSLLELIKLHAQVRRPYQARSLAIIKVCHKLAKDLMGHESKELEIAINRAVDALKQAAMDRTDFKVMDPSSISQSTETINKFDDLMPALETCFKQSELDGWSVQKELIKKAAELDKSRLVRLLERVKIAEVMRLVV